MALVPIKTATTIGYCECLCACYELASIRDDETGKGYCPKCSKEHLELNRGIGIPQPVPSKYPTHENSKHVAGMPEDADPPGRLR
jgi:hypothetical protein